MPKENASACYDCFQTLTVGNVSACFNMTSCHPISLTPFTVEFLDEAVAMQTICNASDPADVCDAPEYCTPVAAAQCNDVPNR